MGKSVLLIFLALVSPWLVALELEGLSGDWRGVRHLGDMDYFAGLQINPDLSGHYYSSSFVGSAAEKYRFTPQDVSDQGGYLEVILRKKDGAVAAKLVLALNESELKGLQVQNLKGNISLIYTLNLRRRQRPSPQ